MLGQRLWWERHLVYLLLSVFSLLIGFVAYRLYQRHTDEIYQHAEYELGSIARLKAHQTALWHENILNQGRAIQNIPGITRMIEAYLRRAPDAPDDQVLLNWMRSLQQYQSFYRISLMDQSGNTRLSIPSDYQPVAGPHFTQLLAEARRTQGAVLSDLYRNNKTHLNLLIPFFANGQSGGDMIGCLFVWIDPQQFLYPFLQARAARSASTEIVLFRREGNEVVCLNELRHRMNTPINLRIPLSQTEKPSVQAIQGKQGLIRGIDYRGVPVLAFIVPVTGTPWFILSKVDEAEFNEPIHDYGWQIASRIGAVILCFILGVGFLWRRRDAVFLRRQLEAEQQRRALEVHYAYLTRYANDIILLADESGRIQDANDRAVQCYGYTRNELCHLKIGDLQSPEAPAPYDFNALQEQGEHGLIYEVEQRRKDDSPFTVEVSARAITIEDKTWHQAIIRDVTERKRIETDLREQFGLLQTLIETSANPIYYKDTQGQLLWCNTAYEQYTGKSRPELIGNTIYDWMPKEIADQILCAELDVLRSREKLTTEITFPRPGGEIQYMIVSKAPTLSATGQPTGIVSVLTDITDYRRTQTALELSEARYRHLLDILPVPVCTCDLEGRLTFYNEQAAALWGRRPNLGEKRWWKPLQIYQPDGTPLPVEDFPLLATLREERDNANQEIIIERPDGSQAHLLPHPEPLRDGSGKIMGAVNVMTDITAIRQIEESLRQSEEKYRNYVDDSPIAILVVDDQGRFTDVNPAACRLSGYSREELCRLAIPDLLVPEFVNEGNRLFAQLKATRHISAELQWMRKDGAILHILVDAAYLAGGQFIGFCQDVTERRRFEQQLRQSQKMEAVGQLAGGIAHDFNNLLQVMSGYVKLALRDKALPPDHRENLEQVMQASERAVTLVRQLLTFSRHQVGNPRPTSLDQTIDGLTRILRRMIGEHIEMKLDLQSEDASIQADPGQVEQVIMNLCINARDAMPQGGQVLIQTRTMALDERFCRRHSWAKPGRYVRLLVTDTGCGIPEQLQERVFEPFFTTKEVDKGTGLGLATVYGIVQQYQGGIILTSRVGQGTTFEIYFPVIAASSRGPLTWDEAPVMPGHETILLAEDDDAVRDLGARILQGAGYQLLVAGDGEAAARIIEQNLPRIDLAILDVVMPKMNGRQLYEKIKALDRKKPILFSSGYSLSVLDASFVPEEDIAMLQKPYTPRELLKLVRAILDQP